MERGRRIVLTTAEWTRQARIMTLIVAFTSSSVVTPHLEVREGKCHVKGDTWKEKRFMETVENASMFVKSQNRI